MRRATFGLGSTLIAVLLGLMLPATTAAAYPYTAEIQRNTCTLSGGAFDHGYVRLKVLQSEWGVSGTNYFKARLQVQERPRGGSTWTVIHTETDRSESFPNDNDSWYLTSTSRYDFTAFKANNYEHRLSVRFQWWDMRSGADQLLSSQTINSKRC